MNYIATKGSFIFLASFLVSILTIIVIWQRRHFRGVHWLILAMSAIALDNFLSVFIVSSINLEQVIFWAKMEYMGGGFSTPLLLIFFLGYPVERVKITPKLVAAILLIPFLSLLAVFTNEYHHLFWTSYQHISGTLNNFSFNHGPFYWILIFYTYACAIGIIFFIIKDLIYYSGIYRFHYIVLLISSFLPILTGILYPFYFSSNLGVDIMPVSYAISGLGIVISIVFLRLFDLVPVSRNMLIDKLQDGVIVLDEERKIIDINPSAVNMFSIWDLRIGKSIEEIGENFPKEFMQTKKSFEVTISQPEIHHYFITPSRMEDKANSFGGCIYIIRNITDIREVESALHLSQERYRSLIDDVVDVSTIGISIIDKDFRIAWVNQATLLNWESSRERLIGIDIRELLKKSFPNRIVNGKQILNKILDSYINDEYLENIEIHIKATDGVPARWLLYSSRPVKVGYYAGGRIDQFVNITEQKKLQAQIELLAITDELTGIYNRRGLFELGKHDFTRAQRTNTLLSVLYLDIDRFKELNDRFGHAMGDQILIELVNRVQTQLRDMDIFARYGGDEFVIMIPDANLDQVSIIAERIRESISEEPFIINDEKYTLFSSIGISQIDPDDDFSKLLDRADRCMYYSKQNGQNQVSTEIDFENNEIINN